MMCMAPSLPQCRLQVNRSAGCSGLLPGFSHLEIQFFRNSDLVFRKKLPFTIGADLWGTPHPALNPVPPAGRPSVARRVQSHLPRQSWVREKKAAPFCAMTQIQWFAWATAGRPYSGHRDHQGVHSPQSNDIYAPGEHKVLLYPIRSRHAFSQLRQASLQMRQCSCMLACLAHSSAH